MQYITSSKKKKRKGDVQSYIFMMRVNVKLINNNYNKTVNACLFKYIYTCIMYI